jgi:hypothetical protein
MVGFRLTVRLTERMAGLQSDRPPQVGTIGDTIAARLHMTLYCDAMGCRHSQPVDLEALRDQFGPDYGVADFVARSRCSKCGAKWPQLSVRVGPIHTGGMR